MTTTIKPRCGKSMCHRRQYRRGLCRVHYADALEHTPGFRIADRADPDLLSQASITGRIHARRGGRCAVDTATRLFGERVAKAYEAGYRSELAQAGAA